MEATGVYWIPVYDILEARGLEVLLVNARHVKHVPGRKSDVEDCEWLRELHSVGLLRGSFRPAAAILALRALLRHRDTLVQTAGTYVQWMQKALVEMNLLLPRVVSDIVGKTGLTILRALVAGERDPHVLAHHRDPHCKATSDEIAAALTGHYRDEHVFVLTQNLELFDMCQTQLLACDTAIEVQLQSLTAAVTPPTTPLPPPRITRRRGNEPHFDIRPVLHHLTGVDLTQIDGLAPYSALQLIAEIGTDPMRWPTEHHFTAWLTLAPQNRVSGGRRLSSKTQPSANRAAGVLRVAAMSLIRSQTALGAFYRRLAVRIGQGAHRDRPQARHLGLSHPDRPARLSRPRSPYLQRAPTRTRLAPTPPTPSALPSSTARPGRYWGQQFLRSGRRGNRRLEALSSVKDWIQGDSSE